MKPLVKYIGGKSWLADELIEIVKNKPNKIYGEAFCGGLGAFLAVESYLTAERIILNDISTPLINTFRMVQTSPDELVEKFALVETEFAKLNLAEVIDKEGLRCAEDYFKKVRSRFNVDKLPEDFLFLQCHSFNGIYRENRKGEYNTPFNWSGKSFKVDEMRNRILELNAVFSKFDTILTNKSVFDVDTREGLWYFDPPYLNDTQVENKYNKDHFGLSEQIRLIEKAESCEDFFYSNHVDERLKFNGDVVVKTVFRRNIMTSNASQRGNLIGEMLAYKK